MIPGKRKKRIIELSHESLADIVTNSLGLILIIMVYVTIISLFRENFAGNMDREQQGAAKLEIKLPKPDNEDLIPVSVMADRYNRPIIIFCKYKKLYVANFDKLYINMYSDAVKGYYQPVYIIDDVEYRLKYSESDRGKLWNVEYRPVKSGGVIPDNPGSGKLFSEGLLKEKLRLTSSDKRDFYINSRHQFYYFIVYPDSFDLCKSIKESLKKMNFNINIQLFAYEKKEEEGYIFFTKGLLTDDWSNYRIQE